MPRTFLFLVCWMTVFLQNRAQSKDQLTPLSPAPDWSKLEIFQRTITGDEFARLLQEVYAPRVDLAPWFIFEPTDVRIAREDGSWFTLVYADQSGARPVPRYWRSANELAPDADHPLSHVKIALDPGHLGGVWAKMEERWFQIGDAKPVTEGDLTLRVAQVLAPKLTALGAEVLWVRSRPGPVTTLVPENLQGSAFLSLVGRGVYPTSRGYSNSFDPWREHSIQWESEKLFYRVAEIHARAELVNNRLKPDLALCLHFNAEPWGDPANPTQVDANHLHLIINGGYSAGELGYGDVRFAMLVKLLNRSFYQEKGIGESIAADLALETQLPPFQYHTNNAQPVGKSGYVWARNLLANRLYQCPVAYVECYVMNSLEFFDRFQAGEYEGLRAFNGVMRKNIYEEYADGVAKGIEAYFRRERR
jgi:hypothetical protein